MGADHGTTIIDGNNSGTVVSMSACSNATLLSGFTLKNGAGVNGGGLSLFNSEPVLSDLLITENSASTNGAGIYFDSSNPSLENVIISGNSATGGGGGLYFRYYSSPGLENVLITGNSAGYGGGVYCWTSSNPSLENVTINGNSASYNGGGMYCASSNPTLTNVTFSGNTASIDGDGVYCGSSSSPILMNTILWDNGTQEVFLSGASDTITFAYSDVQGGQDSIVINDNGTVIWGEGNIDVDPRFIDSENSNYHLLASSHCINGGDPTTFDSDGSRADIGAYPYLTDNMVPVWYINTAGNDTTGTGTSVNPFASIQAGINFSSDADSVTVAAGTYVENIDFRGRNIKVVGEDRETTIIDGNQSGSVVIFLYEFGGGVTAAAMLSGFTITNGGDVEHGGGIRLSGGSNPTLNNLIVQNNEANHGGGISLISSSPTLSNVTISGNTASAGDGGGLRCISSSSTDPSSDPSLMNVTITNNTSNGSGGGIYAENSSFTLDGVTVSNNTSTGDDPQIQEAGGISVSTENSSSNNIHIRIVNSIISGNTASGGSSTGGLFFFAIDSVTIASTEINGNSEIGRASCRERV